MEDQRLHTVATSQKGSLKTWIESRGTPGIALNGEDWYDVRHGRLIITPDGTAQDEESVIHAMHVYVRHYKCVSKQSKYCNVVARLLTLLTIVLIIMTGMAVV